MKRSLAKGVLATLVVVSVFHPSSTNRGDFYKEKDPINIQLPLNDETMLTCEMNLPPDHFKWRFYPLGREHASKPNAPLNLSRLDFKDLPSDSYSLEKKRSTLTIKMTNYTKAGDYLCLAQYGASMYASVPDRITLTTLQRFPPQMDVSRTLVPGNTIVWRCNPPYSNPPAYIDYAKVGVDAFINPLQKNYLIIPSVREEDTGTYKCKATNNIAQKSEESSTTLHLSVRRGLKYSPPEFIIPPKSNYIIKKSQLENTTLLFMECAAVGNPVPKVSWTKINGVLPEYRIHRQPGGLVITNVSANDEGKYMCSFSNSEGVISHNITVTYEEAPIVEEAPKSTKFGEGEKLELECRVKGNPKPQISWLLNGQSVVNEQHVRVNDHRIFFVPIEKAHAGAIQCFASNSLGVSYSTASLTVVPKQISSTDDNQNLQHSSPNPKRKKHKKQKSTSEMIPPSKPTISRLNDESVVVRWDVPHNDGLPIQFFKVQYREFGSVDDNYGKSKSAGWKTTNLDIPPNVKSFEVNNLKPDHIYKFRIAAVYSNNDNLLSEKSDKFHLAKEDFTSKNPLPIPTLTSTVSLNATSIQVFWECTPNQNVTIDGYYINYIPASNAGDYTRATVDGEQMNSFIITHLASDTVYDIKMQSFNTKSASEFSRILKQKTKKPPPEIPKTINASEDKENKENTFDSSLYLICGIGVFVVVIIISVIISLIICKKWKQIKESNSRGTDRNDKSPNEVINHHIQAEGNDYVVKPKTRNNGCTVAPTRITITPNPLADADNKSQNMIEMSCLSSQNNNCTPSGSTQDVPPLVEQPSVVKGKHMHDNKRQKHSTHLPPSENYV